jgi:hypothetical protein
VHHGNQALANLSFSDSSITVNYVTWFPDIGANQHVTPDISGMTHAKPYFSNDKLHVSDGKGLVISNTTYNILHTLNESLLCLIYCMCRKLKNNSYLFNNSVVKIVSFLNFILLFSMLRIL